MGEKYTIIRVDANGSREDLSAEAEVIKALVNADIYGVDAVTEDEIIEKAKNADVILTAAAKMTRRVMEGLPKLRAIIRAGVGYDTIDVAAATDLGILLINNPAQVWCDEEVSNQAMALMLSAVRKVVKVHGLITKGDWRAAQSAVLPAACIHGQTAGIIGCGAIGRMIAKKVRTFNMNVIGYDPYLSADVAEKAGIVLKSLAELVKESDFIFVQTLLNEETYHLLGEKEFALMKPNAYVINCARGENIDEKALIRALQEKRIAGAGLDVLEKEPPEADNPLFRMDNVTLTPHCASWSTVAFETLHKAMGQEAADVLRGIAPGSIVNKGVKPRFALK